MPTVDNNSRYINTHEYESVTINPNRFEQWTIGAGGTGIGSTARPRRKRAGTIKMTTELLKKMLGIPEDVEIIGLYMDQRSTDVIFINVASNNLPEVDEGAYLPQITIQQLSGYDE